MSKSQRPVRKLGSVSDMESATKKFSVFIAVGFFGGLFGIIGKSGEDNGIGKPNFDSWE